MTSLPPSRPHHPLRKGAEGREGPREGAEELGKNIRLISSICSEGIGPSMSIEGSSDKESFGLYLRKVLCPALEREQIVVMDNLSVHRGA